MPDTTLPDDLSARLRAEIERQQGEAAAWGVDTYGDLPRYLALLKEAADDRDSQAEEIRRLREAFSGKFWLEVRHPNRVPRRGGPFPVANKANTLREWMAANPEAFITVVDVDECGVPDFSDAPETLQMLDGRSMSTGRKHIQTSTAAHARPSND